MNERQTIFDALLASLRAAAQYDRNDQIAPAVVLWTDRDGQWRSLLPRVRLTLPQLLTLGDYDPATKTGPAIWLRAMIARTLPQADWPADTVPILYLPRVSRHNLRASTNDRTSSLLEATKTVNAKGEASLVVADDSKEGVAAVIVVLSGTGAVLARYNTTVGED